LATHPYIINLIVGQSSATRELTERQRRALQIVFERTTPTFLGITQYLLDHKAEVATAMNMEVGDFEKIVFDSLADRLNEFLMEKRRRRVLCLPAELDFDEVLDRGQILLVWLSGVSPATIRFIGSLLFQSLSSTILEREQIGIYKGGYSHRLSLVRRSEVENEERMLKPRNEHLPLHFSILPDRLAVCPDPRGNQECTRRFSARPIGIDQLEGAVTALSDWRHLELFAWVARGGKGLADHRLAIPYVTNEQVLAFMIPGHGKLSSL
jgi:hypothetical protein